MLDDASKEIDKGLILDPEHAFGYAAKLQIEFYNKNWEEMFNVAEKAYKLAGDSPHLLGKIGFSLAYGGECKKEDVFASTEKFQTVTTYGIKKNRIKKLILNNNLKGIDRIVSIGSAFNMSEKWDGYDTIHFLSRIINDA